MADNAAVAAPPPPAEMYAQLVALRQQVTDAQAALGTAQNDIRRYKRRAESAERKAERANEQATTAAETARTLSLLNDVRNLVKQHRTEDVILKDGTKKMAWPQSLVKDLKSWHDNADFLRYAAESPPGRMAGFQLLGARYGQANRQYGSELADLRALIRRIDSARAAQRVRQAAANQGAAANAAAPEAGAAAEAAGEAAAAAVEAVAAAAEEMEAGLAKLAADFMSTESRRAALRELYVLFVFNDHQERPVPLGPVLAVLETMDTGSFKYLPESTLMASVPELSVVSLKMKSHRSTLPWGNRTSLTDDEVVGHTYTCSTQFEKLLQRHENRHAEIAADESHHEPKLRGGATNTRRPQERSRKDGRKDKECLKCLYPGHLAVDCPKPQHSEYNEARPYELYNRFREGKVKPE